MRRDLELLTDIERTAAELSSIVAGLDEEEFAGRDVVRSAAMYKLVVIGEAAAKLTPELRERFADVPWPAIVGFRNRVTHAYFAVDWSIAHQVATRDVPDLAGRVRAIIDVLRHEEERP
jgi:uncharacterized protein with HEPN domain